MFSDGTININGVKITINGTTFTHVLGGGADTEWKGHKITETGSAGITSSGGPILIDGKKVDIKGTPVAVNC